MEETIFRHEVLEAMDTGDPFDLVFITADRKRGTGGQIKRVENWVKIKRENDPNVSFGTGTSMTGLNKNPDHTRHNTFNICNPANPGQHPYKVHWRLMIFFNGKRILQ